MSDDDTKQTNSDKKRGVKRGVLRSGRAIDLGKTTDAADAAEAETDDEQAEDDCEE